MSSRLDRLFLLLENGGSDATRQAAAFQLGEVVRLHPHELETLLDRLHAFITSKSWETRIAASQAVDAIIKNIAIWDPHPIKGSEDAELGAKSGSEVLGHLSLESFSIMRVLEKGSYLLGADETQFELDEEDGKLDPKERAARQRLLVNQRLGFDIAEAIGINTHNIFSNSDLTDHVPEDENKPMRSKDSVVQIVQEEMASAGLRMSSRELNRAKRKAKFLSKQKSNDPTDKVKTSDEGPEKKRLKLNHGDDAESDDDENNLTIADDRMFQEQEGEWPLEEFAEHLSRDLFSSSWETRHGAATALRQVIRLQGHGAGRSIYQTAAQMKVSHLSWLEDKAVRLVCVLALDRFGDFLADQVVAPVRETCAQVLGCIVQHVPERIVLTILSLLQEMLLWRDWGTRHGGLLGLKYLLAVRSDMRKELLAKAYDHIYEGLRDEMDDVVAVAATCLVPVAEDLVKCLPSHTINELVATLWEALLDIDDLTASTSSILLLISKLLSYPKILNTFDGDLSQLIPRLWPFLYHSSCSIRTSTLKAIETLLENLSVNRIPLRENSPPVETEREKNHSNQESKTPKIKLGNETKMEIEKSEPNETLKVEEETVHPNGSNGVKLGEMNANSETKLEEVNTNSETKLEEVNTNSETKLEEVNTNSETKLEEVNTNSETKLEMTTNSETKLEEMTTRSETKLKAMTTRSETKLKAMNTRSKTKLEAMNTRSETKLEAMNTRSETKLEAMSTDSETKLGAMSTDSETKLGAMSTDSETKLGAMSTDSETKLGAMSTDSETKLEAMNTDSETKLEAMSTDSETKLEAMNTDSETKLEAMNTDSETKLEAMNTDSETKLEAMNTDSETKLGAMNTDSETKLGAMNTDSETKLEEMNTDSETKLEAMNTDSETKLEAMNTDSETKLGAMNTDSETKLGAMNTDSETKLGAMNTDSETKLEEMNTDSETKLEEMNTDSETKLEEMNTDSETKLEEMNSDSETKMEDNEEKVTTWLENILEPLLIHIYQRGLLENSKENMELIEKIWNLILRNVSLSNLLMVVCRLVSSWLCLMMTGTRIPLDPSLLVLAYHSKSGDGLKKTPRLSELGECVNKLESKYFIGGPKDSMDDRAYEDQVIMARCTVAKLLGNLSHYVTQPMPSVEYQPDQTPILCYVRLLIAHLNSRSAIQRYGAGLVVREWAIQHPHTLCHSLLKESLLNCVMETIYFDEIAWMFTRLQQEAKDFLAMLKHYKIPVDPSFSSVPLLTLEQIQYLCESNSLSAVKLRKNIAETLESRSKSILKNVTQTSTDQIKLSIAVQSVIAGALVRFQFLPEKLNPVIKPLMESVKKETSEQQQKMASSDLTFLLELCIDRQPSPNAKVVKNLASFLCVDEDFTPNIVNSTSRDLIGGILSLSMQQKSANAKLCRRTSSSGGRGPGRPPLKSIPSTSSENSSDVVFESPQDIVIKKQNAVQRRGCTLALVSIVNHLGAELGKKLPHLLNMLFEPLENPPTKELNVEVAQNIINWLQLLETIIPVLHNDLLKKFESLLKVFDLWLYHLYPSVRHMAGRVYAALAAVSTTTVVCSMIENVLPNLGLVGSTEHRMGALECVHLTIEKLGFQIVPYIVLLIVPLLGSMSDPEETVRHLGTQCFATLIRLFPLDGGTALPPNISPKLVSQIAKERVFVDRLLDPRKIENYKIPVPINAELRSYQQKGVNWLAFLNEYNLHGVLCDDMGLGKTLQSICILAGDHYEKETLYKKSKEKPAHAPCHRGYQSLVVCPPTLTGHWYYEVIKFVSKEYLDPLHYTGPPIERRRLRNYFEDHNLIIASYKIVRNEVDFFSKIKWNYIILDEGHTIKNGKTKSSKAIKELVGKHRLILTGTPIQNNVLELWSLFDFLMPGFLGTEKQFMAKYSRPIIQSKEAKSSTKEQEAGVLALEALHRQVLPFLLRRVKEDVLKDLPPKITQDYYCDLSPLQERLYEDFARSRACQTIDETLSSEEKVKPQTHIFQALQYLRRVCNHPKLALLPSHPQYEAISKQIRESKTPLSDIAHAAKLPALKQLLLDCGIGSSDETNPSITPSAVVSPHRALIFCQLKGMLDIIEQDLLKAHLSTVTYLRLDGSVPAGSRHSLVQRFNSDPSIDLLLLTTQVGGLGLNLTGADTVIFVEHDWNPMRDLQAMDRAHRIGQKRVVNVYRLITKGTLEEKIMSLQKFKLMTANSVISQENSSLLSMGTDQLLELFTLDTKSSLDAQNRETSSNGNETQTLGLKGPGIKGAIENLPALWEEGLYDEEYNLDSFLKSLK